MGASNLLSLSSWHIRLVHFLAVKGDRTRWDEAWQGNYAQSLTLLRMGLAVSAGKAYCNFLELGIKSLVDARRETLVYPANVVTSGTDWKLAMHDLPVNLTHVR